MAYKTSDLKKKAIEVIVKYKLIFIEEVAIHINISKATFYKHELNEVNDIKALIDKNKGEIKAALRFKWYKTDNATLQLALMRLVCSDAERRKLAINYTELTGKDGAEIKITSFNYIIPHSENGSNDKTIGKTAPRLPEITGQDN